MNRLLLFFILLIAGEHLLYAQSADELSGISVFPSGSGWFIQVFPDGSVRASYGSLPQHQIQMAPSSIDFGKLLEEIKAVIADHKIDGGTQASLMLLGRSSHTSSYLLNDDFLRDLFPSNPEAWRRIIPKLTKDMKPDGLHISPISDEMSQLLLSHPIFPQKNPNNKGCSKAVAQRRL